MTDQVAQTYLLSCVPLIGFQLIGLTIARVRFLMKRCVAALSDIARGKAPGFDGLPMEFYLVLWDVLGRRSCGGSEFLLPFWFPW